jgi:hypothetical protein
MTADRSPPRWRSLIGYAGLALLFMAPWLALGIALKVMDR